jgi:hypothetical protein
MTKNEDWLISTYKNDKRKKFNRIFQTKNASNKGNVDLFNLLFHSILIVATMFRVHSK